jgi:phosphonate transport system substrate-binding protein
MKKEFKGNDRFFPITYKENWKVVRDIAEGSGTPYNKTAYEAEKAREAAKALKKKQKAKAAAEAPAK